MHDLSDVTSVGITARGHLDEFRFNMFMRDLLAEKARDIFRCKGVLCVHVSRPCACARHCVCGCVCVCVCTWVRVCFHLCVCDCIPYLYGRGAPG